jgi:hypothetical protein
MEGIPNKEAFNSRRQYFDWLSQFNEEVLSRYFDKEIIKHLKERTATAEECQFVRDTLQKKLFVSAEYGNIYDTMENDKGRFREMTIAHAQKTLNEKADIIDGVLERGVVPVLIRPEMLYLAPQVASFLEDRGFEIVYTKLCEISFDQYWTLYDTEFVDPSEETVMRKRAFRYINRPACVLLVRHKERLDPSTCAQVISKNYKGRAGFKDDSTLRGGIFYDETSRILKDDDETELFALDPLMETAYGGYNYVAGAASPLHVHVQGIHIPNPNDVAKDLSILLTREEMEYLRTR